MVWPHLPGAPCRHSATSVSGEQLRERAGAGAGPSPAQRPWDRDPVLGGPQWTLIAPVPRWPAALFRQARLWRHLGNGPAKASENPAVHGALRAGLTDMQSSHRLRPHRRHPSSPPHPPLTPRHTTPFSLVPESLPPSFCPLSAEASWRGKAKPGHLRIHPPSQSTGNTSSLPETDAKRERQRPETKAGRGGVGSWELPPHPRHTCRGHVQYPGEA